MFSRIWNALTSLTRRRYSPMGPSAANSQLHRAWIAEQMKEYPVQRLYASPLDADLNHSQETWEMRLAYRKALKEPAIKGPLLKKVYAVASLTPQVLAEDDQSPADKEAATWIDWAISHSRGGWPRLLHDCGLHPLIEGFGVGEKVFQRIDRGRWQDRWGLHAVKFKETQNLRFKLDQYRNVESVRSFTGTQGGHEFDPKDFVLLTHLPLWENPFGQSDLRAAYRACNLIEASIKLRAILLENYSGPFLKFEAGSSARIEEAGRALANARAAGYIVVEPGDKLDVMNLATSAPDQFQGAIDDLRKEAATAIAGAYLQILESSSPQGNSETHRGVSELFEWWLASTIAAALTEQLVPDLHDPHYPAHVGRPRILLGGVDPSAADKWSQRYTAAMGMKLEVSKHQAYERLEFEPPRNEEDTLGGEQQGAGAAGGGGGANPLATLAGGASPGGGAGGAPPAGPGDPGRPPSDAPGSPQGGQPTGQTHSATPATDQTVASQGIAPATLVGGATGRTGGGQGADSATPAGVPAELLAAMVRAQAAGDSQAVDELADLGANPERLAAVTGGDADEDDPEYPAVKAFADAFPSLPFDDWQAVTFADAPHQRQEGEVWEGQGNRWYKRLHGRTVPTANPNAPKAAGRDPNAPKRDVVAEQKAAKAGREPRREEARRAWQKAVSGEVAPHELPALAAHLQSLTRDELRDVARGLEKRTGGLKANIVNRLLLHVGVDPADAAVHLETHGPREQAKAAFEAAGGAKGAPLATADAYRQAHQEHAKAVRKEAGHNLPLTQPPAVHGKPELTGADARQVNWARGERKKVLDRHAGTETEAAARDHFEGIRTAKEVLEGKDGGHERAIQQRHSESQAEQRPAEQKSAEPQAVRGDVLSEIKKGLTGVHAPIRMVPIHELRDQVAAKFGADAASPEKFNELLLDFRQEKKIKLVPISDPSKVTPEQMSKGMRQSAGHMFYVERGENWDDNDAKAAPADGPKDTVSGAAHEAATPEAIKDHLVAGVKSGLAGVHAPTRMVPIHELRGQIVSKFGPQAASHENFNELLNDLRRDKKIRMVPISDPSRVTPEQMRDSIRTSAGHMFYVEKGDKWDDDEKAVETDPTPPSDAPHEAAIAERHAAGRAAAQGGGGPAPSAPPASLDAHVESLTAAANAAGIHPVGEGLDALENLDVELMDMNPAVREKTTNNEFFRKVAGQARKVQESIDQEEPVRESDLAPWLANQRTKGEQHVKELRALGADKEADFYEQHFPAALNAMQADVKGKAQAAGLWRADPKAVAEAKAAAPAVPKAETTPPAVADDPEAVHAAKGEELKAAWAEQAAAAQGGRTPEAKARREAAQAAVKRLEKEYDGLSAAAREARTKREAADAPPAAPADGSPRTPGHDPARAEVAPVDGVDPAFMRALHQAQAKLGGQDGIGAVKVDRLRAAMPGQYRGDTFDAHLNRLTRDHTLKPLEDAVPVARTAAEKAGHLQAAGRLFTSVAGFRNGEYAAEAARHAGGQRQPPGTPPPGESGKGAGKGAPAKAKPTLFVSKEQVPNTHELNPHEPASWPTLAAQGKRQPLIDAATKLGIGDQAKRLPASKILALLQAKSGRA